MFAKVFEQIFDSSIAADYTVRHMFIDLLILADQTGAVDMTPDAIARRTNVPQETVERCISELCQPDVKSRSPLEDGKRLVPLDSHRDWGWRIVNYGHYRKIRDQEARRSYFRDYQRKRRKKKKSVFNAVVNNGDNVEPSASTSASTSESDWIKELSEDAAYKGIDVPHEHAKAVRWFKERRRQCTRRAFINWLNRADRRLDGGTQRNTPESGRGLGTANEGKSAQYSGVGKVR